MRALQIRNRPATSLRRDRRVIIDRGSLDEAGRDMVPAGEFDRVVEPVDMHPRQFIFESGECRRVPRQDIQTDKRHALRIARKPSRPDRKHAVRFGKALDEVVKGGPDREGRAVRGWHFTIHDDDGAQAAWPQAPRPAHSPNCGRPQLPHRRRRYAPEGVRSMRARTAADGDGPICQAHGRDIPPPAGIGPLAPSLTPGPAVSRYQNEMQGRGFPAFVARKDRSSIRNSLSRPRSPGARCDPRGRTAVPGLRCAHHPGLQRRRG
jgi:hypothetical protein